MWTRSARSTRCSTCGCFRNRNLTVSVIVMFLFAAAFFGALLLVPTYFQQVHGESSQWPACWSPRRESARW